MIRRLKADVERGMPPKKELVVYAPMSQLQADYEQLLDEKKLNIQMVFLMLYMGVSFFGGTVADDEATKKAAAAKEKVK